MNPIEKKCDGICFECEFVEKAIIRRSLSFEYIRETHLRFKMNRMNQIIAREEQRLMIVNRIVAMRCVHSNEKWIKPFHMRFNSI